MGEEMPREDRRDPARTLELLWGTQSPRTRGPKPGLSLERIVETAIKIADTEGLGALSMRRVAEQLGFTTMSLYRYVPSKDELIELAIEAVAGEEIPAPTASTDWRVGLADWARRTIQMYRDHPWVIEVPLNSPPMGPNMITWTERGLATLSDTPLTGGEMIQILVMITGYVRGHAQLTITLSQAEARTGVPEAEWDTAYGQALERAITQGDYPMLARLVSANVFDVEEDDVWLEADFEFGLERILDGIEALITKREASPLS